MGGCGTLSLRGTASPHGDTCCWNMQDLDAAHNEARSASLAHFSMAALGGEASSLKQELKVRMVHTQAGRMRTQRARMVCFARTGRALVPCDAQVSMLQEAALIAKENRRASKAHCKSILEVWLPPVAVLQRISVFTSITPLDGCPIVVQRIRKEDTRPRYKEDAFFDRKEVRWCGAVLRACVPFTTVTTYGP